MREEVGFVLDVDAQLVVAEGALRVHLRDGDVGVPIRDGVLAGVGLERDVAEAVGGWDEDGIADAVEVPVRVVASGSPRSAL